jgi:ornithine--oxo-acid transaminase
MLGFEMVLPMNTGAEAVETAVKIARKWGYKVKGIPENKAWVFSAQENFHGRTVSTSQRQTLVLICGLTYIAVRCHHHVHRP